VLLLPILPVGRPVLQGFGDVFGLNLFAAAQVGYGAGDFQDPILRLCRHQLLLWHGLRTTRRDKGRT
jgi:hypothetical protein